MLRIKRAIFQRDQTGAGKFIHLIYRGQGCRRQTLDPAARFALGCAEQGDPTDGSAEAGRGA
jgi:hypothetical protein